MIPLVGKPIMKCRSERDCSIESSGRIRLSTTMHERAVRLAIEDSGPGIDLKIKPLVFEPFFTTQASGSGLGLAIPSWCNMEELALLSCDRLISPKALARAFD
jgi:nitrogen-specific signal transduction histidine kinase